MVVSLSAISAASMVIPARMSLRSNSFCGFWGLGFFFPPSSASTGTAKNKQRRAATIPFMFVPCGCVDRSAIYLAGALRARGQTPGKPVKAAVVLPGRFLDVDHRRPLPQKALLAQFTCGDAG